jgi:hypothetical protein
MVGRKQFPLVAVLGVQVVLMAIWSLLDCSKSAPNPSPETATQRYRLMDSQSGISVGSWTSQGGRSTLTLKDGHGLPRLVLQADQREGGRISLQDANGQWHDYPAPPPE